MTGTRVTVRSYDDLRGDERISQVQRDAVHEAVIENDEPAVAYVDEWLAEKKDLDPYDGTAQLFAGRVVAETPKAWCLKQGPIGDDDAPESWIPKSSGRIYEAPSKDREAPRTPNRQRSLMDY